MPESSGKTQRGSGHPRQAGTGREIRSSENPETICTPLKSAIGADHDFNLFKSCCAGFRLGIMRTAVSNRGIGSLQVPLQKRDCPLIRIFQVFTSEAVPLIGINLDLVRYFVPGEDRI